MSKTLDAINRDALKSFSRLDEPQLQEVIDQFDREVTTGRDPVRRRKAEQLRWLARSELAAATSRRLVVPLAKLIRDLANQPGSAHAAPVQQLERPAPLVPAPQTAPPRAEGATPMRINVPGLPIAAAMQLERMIDAGGLSGRPSTFEVNIAPLGARAMAINSEWSSVCRTLADATDGPMAAYLNGAIGGDRGAPTEQFARYAAVDHLLRAAGLSPAR